MVSDWVRLAERAVEALERIADVAIDAASQARPDQSSSPQEVTDGQRVS